MRQVGYLAASISVEPGSELAPAYVLYVGGVGRHVPRLRGWGLPFMGTPQGCVSEEATHIMDVSLGRIIALLLVF